MLFMMKIKPDIVFAIFIANFFAKYLGHQYRKFVQTILQYFKELKNLDIIYDS